MRTPERGSRLVPDPGIVGRFHVEDVVAWWRPREDGPAVARIRLDPVVVEALYPIRVAIPAWVSVAERRGGSSGRGNAGVGGTREAAFPPT